MKQRLIPLLVILLLAPMVLAHEGVKNAQVMARMHVMKDVKTAMGVLGGMAKGTQEFDAAQAAEAREALIGLMTRVPDAFRDPAQDPKTEALPIIWTQYDDFLKKNTQMLGALNDLQTATQGDLQAGLGPVGRACRTCHETYRMKQE